MNNTKTVYTDEDFNLACTIVVDCAIVNTAVMVTAMWTGSNEKKLAGTSPTEIGMNGTYESTLTLNLDTAGLVEYTCTATVSPLETPFIASSDEGSDSEVVTIGKFKCN